MTEQEKKIQEIEKRLSKATPGEWWAHLLYDNTDRTVVEPIEFGFFGDIPEEGFDSMEQAQVHADATFIKHAPTDIRWLLDELKRVTARAERMKDALEQVSLGYDPMGEPTDYRDCGAIARQALQDGEKR